MARITLYQDTSRSMVPQTVTYDYNFNSGLHRAHITLDSNGNYAIRVDGQNNSLFENSAKRDAHYKKAIRFLSDEMFNQFHSCDAAYTELHKHTVQLSIGRSMEEEMSKLVNLTFKDIEIQADRQVKKPDTSSVVLKVFEKTNYKGKLPSKENAIANLREEAKHKYFSLWRTHSSERQQFVDNNLEEVYNDSIVKYDELKDYFSEIQDVCAAKANAQYLEDYNNQLNSMVADYNQRRDAFVFNLTEKQKKAINYITGPEDYVDKSLIALSEKVNLPFTVTLETNYSQKEGLLTAKAVIPSYINIPDTKASILSTGRISIKNKLQREMNQGLSSCQIGLSYYLCGYIFNISANIKTIRFSLMARENGDGYYWVQFSREQFFSNDFQSFDPLLFLERCPHVIQYGKASLESINKVDFDNKIKDALLIAEQASDYNKSVITLDDAWKILRAMPDAEDLRKAIAQAQTRGNSVVIVNKKYENILKEL